MAIARVLGILLVAELCCGQGPPAESLTAEAIMARVAANQDRSEKLRSQYIYRQRIHIVTRRTNGKLLREETHDYRVIPTPDGTKKELQFLTGRYWRKGKYLDFQGEPRPEPDSLDGDLVHDFLNDLANEKSKDGLARGLFPLTTQEQAKYQFRLLGEQSLQGRAVYRIGFGPKQKADLCWAGEALIGQADFQPLMVSTKLSRRIPFLVRTMLGTDLPGVGFHVQYQRQKDGVWFPASFGTEFRLHALFFLNRDISVSLQNTAFEHTDVHSKIKYEGPDQ